MLPNCTLRVRTAPGTNASEIGDVYSHYPGVKWRNSVDGCDSDGGGRVFLDCADEDTIDFVCEQMDEDDRVTSYERV
jgi:hypothetical protein